MSPKPLLDQALLVKSLLEYQPDTQFIYLFGSFAQEQQSASSDVDVAVMTVSALDNLVRWELAQKLAKQLQRDVDLIDLKQCSTVLRMQVITEGKVIYDPEGLSGAFDTTTVSMYQHLQEGRQAIVNDFVLDSTNG
ncbi:type VII toxin-antitoxin system MntA family adenylyltransferase antitoxin [Corallincola spongiicola]|uniref:type VII toxin-antitoxin system MntA family adenylyltransferase antitoxin n=1 Tax=Corallincola spongiicola TaxID=2520508 RepID=UPI001A936403|nr:nucleotidyltransferase domain-containing protein [Corallincola spongiicola]